MELLLHQWGDWPELYRNTDKTEATEIVIIYSQMNYRGKLDTYDLDVWKESRALYKQIYRMVEALPKNEEYGISSQMRRAVISISSNIAEGSGRGTLKDYVHFLYNARGSAYELESQIIACADVHLTDKTVLKECYGQVQTVIRLLNGLIASLLKRSNMLREEDVAYGNEEETSVSSSFPEP